MKLKFLTYLSFLVVLMSCNDLELAPTNKFTEENYWTSAEKANMVLNMAYNQMYNNDYYFKTEALSDNLYEGRGSSSERIISSGQADASNNRFADEWRDCYAGIKTCHTLLENIDRVPAMNENLKARMIAEAKFIRAWLYFRLTTWFGDVPLFERDLTLSESQSISRTPKAEVLSFIRSELDRVIAVLPASYAEADRGRITSGAAAALKARTFLFENDWAGVVAATDPIIASDQYSLFASYQGLFLPQNEYNNEVILDISYVPSLKTWGNFYDLAPLSVGARLNAMAPTQELVNDYVMLNGKPIGAAESGYNENDPYKNRDPRLTATVVYHEYKWTKPDGSQQTIYIRPGTAPNGAARVDEYAGQGSNATSTGYYLRKYYDPNAQASFTSGLNLILIRYADVLLMHAEAKNELNQMSETVWNTTIKALRKRAGFTDPAALNYNAAWSQAELREIIRRERRSELAIEGLRIFDLRRWKTAETVLNGHPHGARFGEIGVADGYIQLDKRSFNAERDYLWPVPQSQRDLNPKLGQNPKW